MRILHVSSVMIDYPGGTEKIIWEIAKRQAKNNKVTILQTNLYEENKEFKDSEIRKGVKIITCKNNFFFGGFGFSLKFKRILKKIWEDFDVIHIHGHGRFTSNYCLKFFYGKRPIIYSAQGFFHDKKYYFFKKMYDYFFGERLKNALFCTALTELEINKLKSYGVKSKSIVVINGGVDYEKINSIKNKILLRKKYFGSSKNKNLLYVGRIHESKGIHHVLKVIKDIDINFFIVGKDAGYEHTLKKISEDEKLKHKVKFLGEINEKKLIELYNVTDFFVLYSNWEGFGLVVVEAMAAGNPCIVSNRGSLPYLVKNNYNGFVVNNTKELEDKIKEIIKDNSLRKRLSKNSRIFAEKFSWDKISKKYEKVYFEALNNGV